MSILVTASHPDRVSGLVLYGTHARVVEGDDYPDGLPLAAVQRTVDRLERGWGEAPCLDLFAPSRMDDAGFVGWWSRLLRSGTSPGSVRAVMELNYDIDVRPVLASVQAPTVVIHARDERLVPFRLGRYLAEHIEGARLVCLPTPDHILFTAGDRIAEEVEEFVTGQRPSADPERVLTTLVFTDVAGSTARVAALGDRRWRPQLEAYRAIVAEQVARFRGREVSRAGDGTLASFDGPARGVQCARAIVDEAAARDIPVRAGVHTGECDVGRR